MGDLEKIKEFEKELLERIDPIVENASALTEIIEEVGEKPLNPAMLDEMELCVLTLQGNLELTIKALIDLRGEMKMEHKLSTPSDIIYQDAFQLLVAFCGLPVVMRSFGRDLSAGLISLESIKSSKDHLRNKIARVRDALNCIDNTLDIVEDEATKVKKEKKKEKLSSRVEGIVNDWNT